MQQANSSSQFLAVLSMLLVSAIAVPAPSLQAAALRQSRLAEQTLTQTTLAAETGFMQEYDFPQILQMIEERKQDARERDRLETVLRVSHFSIPSRQRLNLKELPKTERRRYLHLALAYFKDLYDRDGHIAGSWLAAGSAARLKLDLDKAVNQGEGNIPEILLLAQRLAPERFGTVPSDLPSAKSLWQPVGIIRAHSRYRPWSYLDYFLVNVEILKRAFEALSMPGFVVPKIMDNEDYHLDIVEEVKAGKRDGLHSWDPDDILWLRQPKALRRDEHGNPVSPETIADPTLQYAYLGHAEFAHLHNDPLAVYDGGPPMLVRVRQLKIGLEVVRNLDNLAPFDENWFVEVGWMLDNKIRVMFEASRREATEKGGGLWLSPDGHPSQAEDAATKLFGKTVPDVLGDPPVINNATMTFFPEVFRDAYGYSEAEWALLGTSLWGKVDMSSKADHGRRLFGYVLNEREVRTHSEETISVRVPEGMLWELQKAVPPDQVGVSYVWGAADFIELGWIPPELQAHMEDNRFHPFKGLGHMGEMRQFLRQVLTERMAQGLDDPRQFLPLTFEEAHPRFSLPDGANRAITQTRHLERALLRPARQVEAGKITLAEFQKAMAPVMRHIHRGLWTRSPELWKEVLSDEERTKEGEPQQWLGWLFPSRYAKDGEWSAFRAFVDYAEAARQKGVDQSKFRTVVVLGIGGSGNGVKFIANVHNHPNLINLDVEDDEAVQEFIRQQDALEAWGGTLFVVSSKSGGTTETRDLEAVFRKALEDRGLDPTKQFVAITDEGSQMHRQADQYLHVFLNNVTEDTAKGLQIGGRYSKDSYFGLIPGMLSGLAGPTLWDGSLQAEQEVREVAAGTPDPAALLGHQLASVLYYYWLQGRNMVTLHVPPELAGYEGLVEQLVNESLGKQEDTLVVVAGEPQPASAKVLGQDRVLVDIKLGDGPRLDVGEWEGVPKITLWMSNVKAAHHQYYHWELATASLGYLLKVHPFNQPGVEGSKRITREILSATDPEAVEAKLKEAGHLSLQGLVPDYVTPPIALRFTGRTEELIRKQLGDRFNRNDLDEQLKAFFQLVQSGDLVALLPYAADTPALNDAFTEIRTMIRDRLPAHPATHYGIGSRFQHSNNQYYGESDEVAAVVFTFEREPARDIPVPGKPYTLWQANMAHALGTVGNLERLGRRVIRVHLPREYREHPALIANLLQRALDLAVSETVPIPSIHQTGREAVGQSRAIQSAL